MDSNIEISEQRNFLLTPSSRPTEDFVHFPAGIMGNVRKNHLDIQRRGFQKYTVNENGRENTDYIIWWNFTIGNYHDVIPAEEWQALLKDSKTLEKTNEVLLSARNFAQEFYPWQENHKGISVVNAQGFGMASGGAYGIRVSYPHEIKPLIKAVKEGDVQELKEIKTHLAASFVHEYIHEDRDEVMGINDSGYEIVTQMGQFLYDPKGNKIFQRQIKGMMDDLKREGVAGNKGVYSVGAYTALVLIADELGKQRDDFRSVLNNDLDPYKFDSLEKIPNFINSENMLQLKENLLKRSLVSTPQVLINKFNQILASWAPTKA